MSHQHTSLAAGRWQTLSLAKQLANVGSDVAQLIDGKKKIRNCARRRSPVRWNFLI